MDPKGATGQTHAFILSLIYFNSPETPVCLAQLGGGPSEAHGSPSPHAHRFSELSSYVHASSVAQLCPTLCIPMDCSPPGSSVHGIHQARILEWATISYSRESNQSLLCLLHWQADSLSLGPPGKLVGGPKECFRGPQGKRYSERGSIEVHSKWFSMK